MSSGAPYWWREGRWRETTLLSSIDLLAPLSATTSCTWYKLCTVYPTNLPLRISTSHDTITTANPRAALINTNIASLSLVRYNSCGMLAGASWVVCGDREMGMGGVKLRVLESNLGLCGRRIEGGGMYTEKKTIRNYDKSVPRCDV